MEFFLSLTCVQVRRRLGIKNKFILFFTQLALTLTCVQVRLHLNNKNKIKLLFCIVFGLH